MLVCGIDPGKKGGIAFWDPGSPTRIEPWLLTAPMGEPWELLNLLKLHAPDHVFLEQVGARPGQGVTSMFTFGRDWGLIQGLLLALGVPMTLVTPTKWMKVMHQGCTGEIKERSAQAAHRLFPGHNWVAERCRKEHDGMQEAALIAAWGLRSLIHS